MLTKTLYLTSANFSPFLDEVVLQDVQTADHLTEHQDSVTASFEFGKQLVNEHQLSGSLNHGLEGHVWHICPTTMGVPELLNDFFFRSCATNKFTVTNIENYKVILSFWGAEYVPLMR